MEGNESNLNAAHGNSARLAQRTDQQRTELRNVMQRLQELQTHQRDIAARTERLQGQVKPLDAEATSTQVLRLFPLHAKNFCGL